MADGEIRHRGTETTEIIRDAQMTHMFLVSFSVPSVSPWWEAIVQTKPIAGSWKCEV
jgi:hypothetical protein